MVSLDRFYTFTHGPKSIMGTLFGKGQRNSKIVDFTTLIRTLINPYGYQQKQRMFQIEGPWDTSQPENGDQILSRIEVSGVHSGAYSISWT